MPALLNLIEGLDVEHSIIIWEGQPQREWCSIQRRKVVVLMFHSDSSLKDKKLCAR